MDEKYIPKCLATEVSEAARVRIVKIMEECGEMIHACSKVLLWGYKSKNPLDPDKTNIEYFFNEHDDVIRSLNRFCQLELTGEPKLGWISVAAALPAKGRLVLTRGDSGYDLHKVFILAAHHDPEYNSYRAWRTVGNDPLTEYGFEPTHWRTLEDLL